MKIGYLIIGCVLTNVCFADPITSEETVQLPPYSFEKESRSFGYWSIGGLAPGVRFGVRKQLGHHGHEFGVGGRSAFFLSHVQAFGNYLWYPHPSNEDQGYLGIGLSVGLVHIFLVDTSISSWGLSPNFILGKNYLNRPGKERFFQGEIAWPQITDRGEVLLFPSLGVSWGFGF